MSKEYLDRCWYCDTPKDVIKASQRPNGSHIICGEVDGMTGELITEINSGRHTFVVTDAERKRRDDEMEALNQHLVEMNKLYEAAL